MTSRQYPPLLLHPSLYPANRLLMYMPLETTIWQYPTAICPVDSLHPTRPWWKRPILVSTSKNWPSDAEQQVQWAQPTTATLARLNCCFPTLEACLRTWNCWLGRAPWMTLSWTLYPWRSANARKPSLSWLPRREAISAIFRWLST